MCARFGHLMSGAVDCKLVEAAGAEICKMDVELRANVRQAPRRKTIVAHILLQLLGAAFEIVDVVAACKAVKSSRAAHI